MSSAQMETAGGISAAPRFAVVVKTHAWDPFIARQVDRYLAVLGHGDLFISVDETNGPVGPIPHPRVFRFINADMLRMGLADRFERGSLLWWNTDYPHYPFFVAQPAYDYYLFVEYDTCVNRKLSGLMEEIRARETDFVALPTRGDLRVWHWTRFHIQTYPLAELRGSLNCISVYSNRAMRLLMRRRLEMSEQSAAGGVGFWPVNEVFLATEIHRAGYRFIPLSEFGDADGFEWYPPHFEGDLPQLAGRTFLHPVLDQDRFIASLLRFSNLPAYFHPRSRLRRAMGRFPDSGYERRLPGAFWRRAEMRARERWQDFAVWIGTTVRPPPASSGLAGRAERDAA